MNQDLTTATVDAPRVFKEPTVARVCEVIGALSAIGGALIFIFAMVDLFSSKPSRGLDSAVALAVALMFGSIVWFVAARALVLLAKIEHNTAAK